MMLQKNVCLEKGIVKFIFSAIIRANKEQEGSFMREMKTASQSLTEQQYFIRPPHINHYGRLTGKAGNQ